MSSITFDDLGFENLDTSFLTVEAKEILIDIKKQAMGMTKKQLEDWIIFPYYELMKVRMGLDPWGKNEECSRCGKWKKQ